jgi:hypothetical protein
LQNKPLVIEDERLFKVLGQQEAYKILVEQKEKAKENQLEHAI